LKDHGPAQRPRWPLSWLLRFVAWFLDRLYQPWAWGYDLVANAASLGRWWQWQRAADDQLPTGRLLEIGHGTGHLLAAHLGEGRSVVGLDRSVQMSRLAAGRLQEAGLPTPLVLADAHRLPFAGRAFSGVVATFPSLDLLTGPLSAEVMRVIRPGGRLLVVMAAWIIGQGLLERLARGWFAVTGQSDPPTQWNPSWSVNLSPSVQWSLVSVARSKVLVASVERPALDEPA
jgi:SAM-dependent methyltransferase